MAQPHRLQQYLPFTVLKHDEGHDQSTIVRPVATVLTVYGIETDSRIATASASLSCNSTYRLRY